eukprot:554317-Alexandrium_andersonii.AAC.1
MKAWATSAPMRLLAPWGSAQRAVVLVAGLLETDVPGERRRLEPVELVERGVLVTVRQLVWAGIAVPPLAVDVG